MSDDAVERSSPTGQPTSRDPGSEARAREDMIIDAFVALTDTMIDEYDVIEFLGRLAERSVTLLGADEAGIMLADSRGNLQVIAASGERTRLLELFELQNEEGPCLDAFRTGTMAMSVDLDEDERRWPAFTIRARADGFAAVVSLPLRLRRTVIGAMSLLSDEPRQLGGGDLKLAQALADVATIGLLQQRAVSESRTSAGQLKLALSSRVLIEQAKGVIAARNDVDIDAAFELIRGFARRNGRKLTEVARAVVEEHLEIR